VVLEKSPAEPRSSVVTALVPSPSPADEAVPIGPQATETGPQAPETGRDQAAIGGRRWLGLAAVLAAMIMNLLDSTVVNVGAPTIRADLGGSLASLQWIAASYTLALAVALLTGGRLGDLYGRRRMLLIGVTGFVAASLGCASASSPESLIGARTVQGLFAAVVVPQAFGLIRDLFPPAEIGKAFATLGPVIGLSMVAGPVVGGSLIKLDVLGSGWRSIFLINLPIGVFAVIAAVKALPGRAADQPRPGRFDGLGTLIAGIGMFMLVYPLVQGRELGWPGWIFGLLAASVAVLAVFVAQQVRRSRSGLTPLVELSVLAKRSYASGVVFVIVFYGAVVGFSLSIGLFLQVGLGFTAMRASLFLAALSVGAFLGSGVGAVAVGKVGRPVLHLGLIIMAAGSGALLLELSGLNPAESPGALRLAPALLLFGIGMGMIFVPLFDIIMGDVQDHEVGSAAGLLESLQQLGASLGVAVLATVFFSKLGLDKVGPQAALAAGRHIDAAQATVLLTLALTVLAFGIGFLLPKQARQPF
jgi:EmrB/QacA subfamily drug resistance transporter